METAVCHRRVSFNLKSLFYCVFFCHPHLVLTCAEGHYNVNNNSNNVRCVSKAVVSPFRSKTERILAPVDQRIPGPGAYSPHLAPAPVKRTILQWVNILWLWIFNIHLFKSAVLTVFPGRDIFQRCQPHPWPSRRTHPCQDPGSTTLGLIRACTNTQCPVQLLHLKLNEYLKALWLIQVQVQVKNCKHV